MSWNADEIDQAGRIIADMQRCSVSRTTTLRQERLTLVQSDLADLREELRCQIPGVVVRQLLRLLGFDEHHHFRWRLEHKLIQALVLHQFCPESVPPTRGFAREFQFTPPLDRERRLHGLISKGNLVKPVLGYGSGERKAADWGLTAIESLEFASNPVQNVSAENFVIQERIPIAREYRVNSIEDRVIPSLTFHRYDFGDISSREREAVNAYVQAILDRLPDAMVHGSLFAWDVAKTREDRFIVIEINLTGFHPVFERGFQCTGLFSDPACAAAMTGKLLTFVEQHFQVKIEVLAHNLDDSEETRAYVWASRWKELSNIAGNISGLERTSRRGEGLQNRDRTLAFGEGTYYFFLSQLCEKARPLNDLSLVSSSVLKHESSPAVDPNGLPTRDINASPTSLEEERVITLPRSSNSMFVGPRTPTEYAIAAIWGEVLEVIDPGVHDDFLELGGDSLRATSVIARIRRDFGIEVPLGAFFEGPWTIAGISAVIDEFTSRTGCEK